MERAAARGSAKRTGCAQVAAQRSSSGGRKKNTTPRSRRGVERFGQGSDPMDDRDCGRHAESRHGSALPAAHSGRVAFGRQSARVRFFCRTDANPVSDDCAVQQEITRHAPREGPSRAMISLVRRGQFQPFRFRQVGPQPLASPRHRPACDAVLKLVEHPRRTPGRRAMPSSRRAASDSQAQHRERASACGSNLFS